MTWPTRARAGLRQRHQPGVMNRSEAAYAAHLDVLKRCGEVIEYWFEQFTLKLAHDTRYTPDFLVQMPDGELQLHEVKGHFEDDALVKVKVAAEMFPFRIVVVKIQHGQVIETKEITR